MPLHSLKLTGFRNIASLSLDLSPQINVIHGVNGSGKTSLLEAVHLLAMARSFRTSKYKSYIHQGEASCTLFSQLTPAGHSRPLPVGFQRSLDGNLHIKVNGESVDSVAELAELLPVQLINSDSFLLLEGSPAVRRQYMDWGGFHGDPLFFEAWRSVKRALKQRNSLLKCGKMDASVRAVWDGEFIRHAEALDRCRQVYIEALIPCFFEVLNELSDLQNLTLSYQRGWDRKRSLAEVLDDGFARDLQMGFTQQGPQRADLQVRAGGVAAAEVLSRGQQKLVVSALKVAQGLLLQRLLGRPCVYLVDDLPAELDEQHRRKLCQLLGSMQSQLLLTSIEGDAFSGYWPDVEVQTFELHQGQLVGCKQ